MRQWTVDAFAAAPFRGNPACVLAPLDAWPADVWMQALAAENNHAETAFLLKTPDPARFGLRWFTPTVEVPLCGHATLASSHVLLSELGLQAHVLTFDSLSGELRVRRAGGGYEMDFPVSPQRSIDVPDGLAEALGAAPLALWTGLRMVALLADEATVRSLRPDLARLQAIVALHSDGSGNLGVTAAADPGKPYDLVSRFFAPGSGIPEDPTTGGYHTGAAPIFAARLGRNRLCFHQAYPGRGGDLECEVLGERVLIRGQAVTVMESRLLV